MNNPVVVAGIQVSERNITPSTEAQQARELAIDMLTTAVTAARAKAREDLYNDEKYGPDIEAAANEYIGILQERNNQVRDMLQ